VGFPVFSFIVPAIFDRHPAWWHGLGARGSTAKMAVTQAGIVDRPSPTVKPLSAVDLSKVSLFYN